jgi:hypothetical protein
MTTSTTPPSAAELKHKAAELKETIVEGAKEFKEEEVKSAGGSKAFIAGGVGGICTVLVGASPPLLAASSPAPRLNGQC